MSDRLEEIKKRYRPANIPESVQELEDDPLTGAVNTGRAIENTVNLLSGYLPNRNQLSDISEATKEKKFLSPNIHTPEYGTPLEIIESIPDYQKPVVWQNIPPEIKKKLEQQKVVTQYPRSKQLDPTTKQVLSTVLSPAETFVSGVKLGAEEIKTGIKEIGKGNLPKGGIDIVNGVFESLIAGATPFNPVLAGFSITNKLGVDVGGEDVMNKIMSPFSQAFADPVAEEIFRLKKQKKTDEQISRQLGITLSQIKEKEESVRNSLLKSADTIYNLALFHKTSQAGRKLKTELIKTKKGDRHRDPVTKKFVETPKEKPQTEFKLPKEKVETKPVKNVTQEKLPLELKEKTKPKEESPKEYAVEIINPEGKAELFVGEGKNHKPALEKARDRYGTEFVDKTVIDNGLAVGVMEGNKFTEQKRQAGVPKDQPKETKVETTVERLKREALGEEKAKDFVVPEQTSAEPIKRVVRKIPRGYSITEGKQSGKYIVSFFEQGAKKGKSFDTEAKAIEFIETRNNALSEFKRNTTTNLGFSPLNYKSQIKYGAYVLRQGTTKFTDWSKQMVKDFGNKIKPQLLRIWSEVKKGLEWVKGRVSESEFAKMTFDKVQSMLESKFNPARPLKMMGETPPITIKPDVYKQDLIKSLKGTISEMIFQRRVNTEVANFESAQFVYKLENKKIDGKRINKNQLEVIPFIIEGTKIPKKLGRPELENIYNTQKNKLTPIANEVKQHFDKMWKKVVENTEKLSAEQIENYVTHLWDIPKNKIKDVANWFSTRNRFLDKRFIETLEEGIDKFNLKPKELDIANIIRIHDNITNSVIENAKFVKDLKTLEKDGLPLIMRSDKAPPNWVTVDHPALQTFAYIASEPPKLVKMPYKIHPDLKQPLNVIFGKRSFDSSALENVARAWEMVDAVLKKSVLSLSFFHHGALLETGVAKTNPFAILKVLGKETISKGFKERFRDNPLMTHPETADAIRHGVQFGHTLDINVHRIQKMLDTVARKTGDIPVINRATKFASTFNKKWDKFLWDYIHDPLKLYAYADAKTKIPKGVDKETYLRTQAQLINDTFGGQHWDVLGVDPKMQRVMRFFLLSPDWTVSTVRQALAPTGFGGKNPTGRKIRAKAGAIFWAKAGMYFGVGINTLNAYFRKQDQQEHPEYYPDDMDIWDLSMFGNSLGHKTHLFTGRYEDGTERYLRWGKQFRELPELIMDDEGISFPRPLLKKLGGKTAPLLQLSSRIFTGKSPSGYEDWNLKNKRGWDYTLGIMRTIGESMLPFSSQSLFRGYKEWTPTDLMMPSSKGMSKSKAIDFFKKAIIQNDLDYVKEVYVNAVRNDLDAFGLFKTAMSVVKAEGTRELLQDVKTIEDAKKLFEETTDPIEKKKISNKAKRLTEELKRKKNAFKILDILLERLEKQDTSLKEIK